MIYSTEEPSTIEIQNTKKTDNGILVNLLIHWNPEQITVDDMDEESHQEWEYEEETLSVNYNGDPAQIDQYLQKHQKELLLKAKGKADKLESTDKDHLSYPMFKADSSYYGQIAEIDVSRSDKKYLKVEKTIGGRTVSAWCYVDYSLLLAYQNNDIATGDYVVISFVDEDLDLPYAQGKVVGV